MRQIILKMKIYLIVLDLRKLLQIQNYFFESENVVFDNKNKIIKSDFPTKII